MELAFNCPIDVAAIKQNKCNLCQKEVIDCRDKSINEIQKLQEVKPGFCGVFRRSQIKRNESSRLQTMFRIAFVWVFFFGLDAPILNAQESDVKITDTVKVDKSEEIILKGKVVDPDSSALPFAKVLVKLDSTWVGARTNYVGEYQINLDGTLIGTSAEIIISFVGLLQDTSLIKLEKYNEVNIQLKENSELHFVGLIIVDKPEKNRRRLDDPYKLGQEMIREDEEFYWDE